MRLFVALELPWKLRERLSLMAGGVPGARWVSPENYHLTLRFIGETRRMPPRTSTWPWPDCTRAASR